MPRSSVSGVAGVEAWILRTGGTPPMRSQMRFSEVLASEKRVLCSCARSKLASSLWLSFCLEMSATLAKQPNSRLIIAVCLEGTFFFAFFGIFLCLLLASGFWLLASGFWLLASGSFGFWASGLYLLHFGAKISDLRAICCSLEPICMPIWLLASGSFGFWLLACICCILEPKSLICVLFAAVGSQFACPFGFWLWLHLTLGFWFLFFVVFLALVSLGFWPHFC